MDGGTRGGLRSTGSSLLLTLGPGVFALDVTAVQEVLPLTTLHGYPGAPAHVAGFLDYRGQPIVAYDVCRLHLGHQSIRRRSTRLLVVRDGGDPFALIVEGVREATRLADSQSRTHVSADGLTHRTSIAELLPATERWSPNSAAPPTA